MISIREEIAISTPPDVLWRSVAVRGLANRYRHPGIGAPLAAATEPIVVERGMQVAPRMKLPMTAVLRLDMPRRQLAQRQLHATVDLYDTHGGDATAIAGRTVPLEADETAVLACVLASPEIWERELKAFFSGVFSESTPTQLASIDAYRPGRIPIVFVHGTASSVGRWGDMVNDLLDDSGSSPTIPATRCSIRRRYCARRCATRCTSSTRRVPTPRCRRWSSGHSQGGLLAKALVVDTGDRVWDAIAYKPFDEIDLVPERRDLLRHAIFIKPLPYVRLVVFIATLHRASYLTEFPVTELLGRFLTLPVRILQIGADLARNAGDFKVNPRNLGSGSLFGMTPNNPVLQTMAATPIAPGVHAHSIIAVKGNGPVEGGNDGVVEYSSAHLEGVDSEYIVRSSHSTQSNSYTIEEVRRILLLHAAEVCARIAFGCRRLARGCRR